MTGGFIVYLTRPSDTSTLLMLHQVPGQHLNKLSAPPPQAPCASDARWCLSIIGMIAFSIADESWYAYQLAPHTSRWGSGRMLRLCNLVIQKIQKQHIACAVKRSWIKENNSCASHFQKISFQSQQQMMMGTYRTMTPIVPSSAHRRHSDGNYDIDVREFSVNERNVAPYFEVDIKNSWPKRLHASWDLFRSEIRIFWLCAYHRWIRFQNTISAIRWTWPMAVSPKKHWHSNRAIASGTRALPIASLYVGQWHQLV